MHSVQFIIWVTEPICHSLLVMRLLAYLREPKSLQTQCLVNIKAKKHSSKTYIRLHILSRPVLTVCLEYLMNTIFRHFVFKKINAVQLNIASVSLPAPEICILLKTP